MNRIICENSRLYEKISTGTARYDLDPIRSSKVRIQRHLKAFYINVT